MSKDNQGLSRSERLKRKILFDNLFRKGKYFKTNFFHLNSLPNDINIIRFGITAPKSLFPKATQRNRIKRVIRDVLRRNKRFLVEGNDILVRPKKSELINLKYSELENELLELLKTAKLLKGK